MRAESVWRRQGFALVPWCAKSRDALLALRDGEECVAEIMVAQNPAQLKKYWALIDVVAEGFDVDKYDLSKCVLEALGFVGSLSPQNMDRVEFKALMLHVIYALEKLTRVAPNDVIREWNDALRLHR